MCCPACCSPAGRKHGHHERTVADLPWQGRPVHLQLRLQRFRCSNPACARRSFSESVEEVVRRHAGRSQRLSDLRCNIGLARGGEPGARLAQRLAMPASADTPLRLVRAVPLPFHPDRQAKHLNNVIEADHGKLKQLIRFVRGFKSLKTACAAIKGFEVVRALRKGQASAFNVTGDVRGEARIVERAFGLGASALAEVVQVIGQRLDVEAA